jgi:hypothetical protein
LAHRIDIEATLTNCFERYGIAHLSPSSCNTYAASPAAFVLDKILKRKGEVGPAAHRGTATEAGVVLGLTTNATTEECVRHADAEFWRLTAMSNDPRREKERAAVGEMVKVGLNELRPYGPPTSTQGKIEYRVEGLHVPLVGFYDIEWANHKILNDLKTTHALPSQIKISHARQVALYVAARGGDLDARLTYVTPKKCATYRLENVQDHVKSLENIALSIQKFLSISSDPKELASIVVPDLESFYFNDPDTRQAAYEVWKI